MSDRSFASVGWVATVAGAALGCYLVSLRVASERAALEDVETEMVMAQRDIRVLQTEIGTRGRLAQLERWNARVLALSAPSADQFLDGGFALAKLTTPANPVNMDAPVVLASARVEPQATQPSQPQAKLIPADFRPGEPPETSLSPNAMMHQASYRRPSRDDVSETVSSGEAGLAVKTGPVKIGPTVKIGPVKTGSVKTGSVKIAAVKTASVKTAAVDPLAPKPGTAPATTRKTPKDSGPAQ